MERTFLMLKPDAIRRKLAGLIISRFEGLGFSIEAIKLVIPDRLTVESHYVEHAAKPFYKDLVNFVSSGKIMPIVVSHPNAIVLARAMIGPVGGDVPSTIRGELCIVGIPLYENLIHSSDCPEAVTREISLWFPDFDQSFREE